MVKKIIVISDNHILSKKNNGKAQILNLGGDLQHIDRDKLAVDYINFIGELNEKYNSLDWWAGSISSKNQYVSDLYRNICYYIEIIETIKQSKKDEITIAVDNKYLISQLELYCEKKNIKCMILKKAKENKLSNFIKSIKNNTLSLFYKLNEKNIVAKKLNKQIKTRLKTNESYYVLRTWLDNRSFDSNNRYRDIFYGSLVDYIHKRENLIILGVFLSSFEENLAKVKDNNSRHPILVIPTSLFIRFSDYLKAFVLQLKIFFQSNSQINLSKDIEFHGYNIHLLIKEEMINNLFNGEFRDNLLHYYAAKNFARKIKCKYYTVPYENHSWEKLTIMALKKYSPDTLVLGYQHSSISRRLFNYFLGKDESNVIPLPDKIITVGNRPKKILEKYGNIPGEIITEGCTFRYEYLLKKKPRRRKKNKKILVALPVDLNDSINIITFLLKAFEKNKAFTLKIKCHPLRPIEDIMSKSGLKLPNNFEVIKNKTIEKLLEEVDMFLYSDTASCMEALMLGVPAIFIDIDSLYEKDPLFECQYLKWTVKNKKDLIKVINEINNMSDKEFKRQQKLGRQYMKNYYFTVNEKRMDEFIKKK
jgi:surface carbohydrate biosynthesis protein (TIGR04326 family)